MKYKLSIIITTIMLSTTAMSQALRMPTLEDLIPGGETYRYAESIYGLQWWGDTAIKPEIDSLFAINPATGKENLLFTRKAMNTALEAAGIKPISHLYNVSLPWPGETKILLPAGSQFWNRYCNRCLLEYLWGWGTCMPS